MNKLAKRHNAYDCLPVELIDEIKRYFPAGTLYLPVGQRRTEDLPSRNREIRKKYRQYKRSKHRRTRKSPIKRLANEYQLSRRQISNILKQYSDEDLADRDAEIRQRYGWYQNSKIERKRTDPIGVLAAEYELSTNMIESIIGDDDCKEEPFEDENLNEEEHEDEDFDEENIEDEDFDEIELTDITAATLMALLKGKPDLPRFSSYHPKNIVAHFDPLDDEDGGSSYEFLVEKLKHSYQLNDFQTYQNLCDTLVEYGQGNPDEHALMHIIDEYTEDPVKVDDSDR